MWPKLRSFFPDFNWCNKYRLFHICLRPWPFIRFALYFCIAFIFLTLRSSPLAIIFLKFIILRCQVWIGESETEYVPTSDSVVTSTALYQRVSTSLVSVIKVYTLQFPPALPTKLLVCKPVSSTPPSLDPPMKYRTLHSQKKKVSLALFLPHSVQRASCQDAKRSV